MKPESCLSKEKKTLSFFLNITRLSWIVFSKCFLKIVIRCAISIFYLFWVVYITEMKSWYNICVFCRRFFRNEKNKYDRDEYVSTNMKFEKRSVFVREEEGDNAKYISIIHYRSIFKLTLSKTFNFWDF